VLILWKQPRESLKAQAIKSSKAVAMPSPLRSHSACNPARPGTPALQLPDSRRCRTAAHRCERSRPALARRAPSKRRAYRSRHRSVAGEVCRRRADQSRTVPLQTRPAPAICMAASTIASLAFDPSQTPGQVAKRLGRVLINPAECLLWMAPALQGVN
jgi:hypothetical protein